MSPIAGRRRPRRATPALVAALLVVGAVASCDAGSVLRLPTAKVGRKCSGGGFARDGGRVVQCVKGRWKVTMSVADAIARIDAYNAAQAAAATTTAPPPQAPTAPPATVPPPAPYRAASVSTGYDHTCAVLVDRTVVCWGNANFRQLGDGTLGGAVNTPVRMVGVTDATSVAAGRYMTCVIVGAGSVRCVGWYADMPVNQATTATDVPGITDATQLSVGGQQVCAVRATGAVACWGWNEHGELGDGSVTPRFAPAPVAGITNAVQVAAGSQHTCALLADGTVRCWGANPSGVLGDGTTTDRWTPATVQGLGDVTQLAAGQDFTCARRADATAWCWGWNSSGQLGRSTGFADADPVPAPVPGVTGVVEVGASLYTSCVRLAGGTVRCFGNDTYHQFGDGPSVTGGSGTVSGVADAASLTMAEIHGCVLRTDATVACWGTNNYGSLGNGTFDWTSPTPRTVVGF